MCLCLPPPFFSLLILHRIKVTHNLMIIDNHVESRHRLLPTQGQGNIEYVWIMVRKSNNFFDSKYLLYTCSII